MDIGGLLRGAVSGAQSAAEEILVQFKADTSALDAAMSKLDRAIAREEAQNTKKTAAYQAALQKALALEEDYDRKSQQLSEARAKAQEMAVLGVTKATDAEVTALQQELMAKAKAVESAQVHAGAIGNETKALTAHIAMLKADQAALQQRSAAMGSGPAGISAGGAAVLGGLGAVGTMVAMNAVMALGRAVESTATSFAKYAHEVDHAAKLMGTTTENASVLVYAFNQFGLSASDVDRTIVQMTRHIVANGDQFAALGIQTKDANGELKSSYDIFDQLRHVMSNAADGTAKTALQLQLASRGGSAAGQSFAELNQILSLTDDQWHALERQARLHNAVLSETEALMGTDMVQSGRTFNQAIDGVGRALSRVVAGPITDFLNGLNDILDTLAAFGKETADLNIFQKIGAAFDFSQSGTDRFGRVRADVEQAKRDRATIAALQSQGNDSVDPGINYGGGGGGGNTAARQALQDQIDAAREAAQAAQDALREELTAFERTKNREIALIDEQQAASTKAHDAEIRGIEDQQRAEQNAFDARQRHHQDDIAALRDQLSLMEQGWQEEDARTQIAVDEASLKKEQAREVFRTKGMTDEQYQQAVFAHNRQIADSEKRLADERKKLARDEIKVSIGDRIKAIEKQAEVERLNLEVDKKAAETRMREIRDEMTAEKAQSDAKVKALRDEMTVQQQRVDDAIKQIQKESKAVIDALNEQLKAVERFTSGATAGYGNLAAAAERARAAAAAAAAAAAGEAAAQAAANAGASASTGGLPTTGAGSHGPTTSEQRPHGFAGFWWDYMHRDLGDQTAPSDNTTPLQFAAGGSMLLTEPTALMSMRTGRTLATAAMRAPEVATFGGEGMGAQGGGGDIQIDVYVDGEPARAKVVRGMASSARRGYDLRRRA